MNRILAGSSGNIISGQAAVLGLVAALRPNEPIAFALNRGLVAIPGATKLWGNLLYCNWRFAQGTAYSGRFARYFPELVAYVQKLKSSRKASTLRTCL